ncbi:DNA dC-_dU-editing enzyme APOBEC-3A-like [Myotis yumanensis]|uniref:DNA dC->dU-editing enzyme APOBEC-3A-like n=1 Tax=Myotis yumanensis TaxID=159337 RepID=UPI0038CFC776
MAAVEESELATRGLSCGGSVSCARTLLRPLMKKRTFKRNFGNKCENQTYLCYEVEVQEDDAWVPVEGLQGIRRKLITGTHREHCQEESVLLDGNNRQERYLHADLCFLDGNNDRKRYPRAELCFLALFRTWDLDEGKQYRLTWYSSWSPYPDCVPKLVEFLGDNSNVSLRIFAAGIHSRFSGYEHELRNLVDAGAQLAIMTQDELQHCWDTFVGNRGQPFEPWPNLEEHIQTKSQELESILGNQEN